MTDDSGLDQTYVRAEQTIQAISWISWFGIYPIASEAFGTKKPYIIRSIAILTILTSVAFWMYNLGNPEHKRASKELLLWCGDKKLSARELRMMYSYSPWGDTDAFEGTVARLEQENRRKQKDSKEEVKKQADPADEETNDEQDVQEDTVIAAHRSLPLEQQCFGQYHSWQLLTNAFLHSGFFHLAGNLLFLMVFGSRVNALIGNILTLIIYPVLAISASYIYSLSSRGEYPHPALGASGAIMGLAGMYLILFPIHRVHCAIWLRRGLFGGFQLYMKIFAVRGFWVVLFYIAFDIVFTAFGFKDHVAHWAHLGGFITGNVLGVVLLLTRAVNARGGDLFTAVLGRRAWALVGKPR